MWNPDLDEKALLDRFFAGYYGAGAPFVREYFEKMRANVRANPKQFIGIFNQKPPAWYTAAFAKEARELFGIAPGDTLLILGDDKSGIIVTPPSLVQDAAMRVFKKMDQADEKENNR
jgi:hypothetical protein